MNVNPILPTSLIIAASANPVCAGTAVTFTATPTNGGSTPAFLWQLNGSDLTDETGSTYTSSLTDADQVKCTMTSSEACVSGSPATSNTITLTVNPLPNNAGAITGVTTVCQGQNSEIYTVPTIDNAATYIWTLPAGAAGTSSTNEISVHFGASAIPGNITVNGSNSCGYSAISTLAITVNVKPEAPTITQNVNILHSNALNGNQWYNSSQLINAAVNQDYTVMSNDLYYDIVSIDGCNSEPSNSINVVTIGVDITSNNKSIEVYPNPVSNELTIEVKGSADRTDFEILNLAGQIVFKGSVLERTVVQTTTFPSGLYIIKLENGKTFEFKKIVKE
jgi:hypothetical protein